ncbi:MAG: hypothetical protein RBR77_16085 [Thauera sp.]|jgi:hypothetical protein|nr:hypothetical protein [Thauera sp.]
MGASALEKKKMHYPVILDWEMANSVPGKAAAVATEETNAPAEPPAPAKRWYELVREQA